MKKIFTLFGMGLLLIMSAEAQMRYVDEVFTDVTVTAEVTYDSNYSVLTGSPVLTGLNMDVYEPTGDSISDRPVVILAHAGSFLPKCVNMANTFNGLPLGNKKDSAIVEMCRQFAKRGYVAVAMDYRLGWNPISTDADVRAGTIIQAVYRGMQDMKSCVRRLKLDAATYGIDTNKIVVGGSNSGGYMALAYGSLNDTAETQLLKFRNSTSGDPYIDMDQLGNWDGRGGSPALNRYGNAGPSSEAQMVLNLGGAIGDSSWIEAGELPIVAFHGVEDALTPYKTATVIVAATQQSVVEVSGSYVVCRENEAAGNQTLYDQFFTDAYTVEANSKNDGHDGLFPFPGAANGYEPWAWYDSTNFCAVGSGSQANPGANKTKALAYIDTIMGYFCPRAVQVLELPGNTVGIEQVVDLENEVKLFPNPAEGHFFINSNIEVLNVSMFDLNGQLVWSNQNERKERIRINTDQFEEGLYIVRIETVEGSVRKKVIVQ